jgi:hypothetical protein
MDRALLLGEPLLLLTQNLFIICNTFCPRKYSISPHLPQLFLCHILPSRSYHACSAFTVVSFVKGPFAKFVDSPYYSEWELCGGAVTVSFSKYLPWQAMHFLQRSTHFSKTRCRLLVTSKFLASELPFRVWKSPEIAWGEIWIEFCVRFGKSGSVKPH